MQVALDSSPQEEFLSLLGGAHASPPVHQFLVYSLGGEAHIKGCLWFWKRTSAYYPQSSSGAVLNFFFGMTCCTILYVVEYLSLFWLSKDL
ncbi:hypothetical protein SLEP1_g39690 [Rubroshorea leprosula]|uniref:Uncharacterized protein n=1 Tax=Rubroshorea leprosula TaxID=152421 RepID=A0AAV5L0Z2_9ROSI|nr:hypothetical protein SLEP1_g39690 [Rubroshorea leprosula]